VTPQEALIQSCNDKVVLNAFSGARTMFFVYGLTMRCLHEPMSAGVVSEGSFRHSSAVRMPGLILPLGFALWDGSGLCWALSPVIPWGGSETPFVMVMFSMLLFTGKCALQDAQTFDNLMGQHLRRVVAGGILSRRASVVLKFKTDAPVSEVPQPDQGISLGFEQGSPTEIGLDVAGSPHCASLLKQPGQLRSGNQYSSPKAKGLQASVLDASMNSKL
jgi:hypothetical protein